MCSSRRGRLRQVRLCGDAQRGPQLQQRGHCVPALTTLARSSGFFAPAGHSRVPMAVAAGLPGGRHQPLDLGRRQILTGTN